MLIQKRGMCRRIGGVLSGFVCFAFVIAASVAFAETTVPSFCQLSMQNLEQEVANFQELIALVTLHREDPEAFARQEEIRQAAYEQAKTDLFSANEMTDEAFVLYMGKNGREVEAYLDGDPALKARIGELSGQVLSLMEQFEALKNALNAPADLPPE